MPVRQFSKCSVHVFFTAAVLLVKLCHAATLGPVPEAVDVIKYEKMATPFDMPALKSKWRERIEAIKASGQLPIIDIESSYSPKNWIPKVLPSRWISMAWL